MANRYVLGADIRVTGNYKSQLNTFLNSIKRCEREFDSFTQKVVKDTKAIETSLNQTQLLNLMHFKKKCQNL